MPRRRSQTQIPTSTETEADQSNPDYSEFRDEVNTWFQDLFLDTDPKTGYLVKEPQGVYGIRLKQLVHYIVQQSNEVKAIQTQQRVQTSSVCLYMGHVVQFLSEYILPAVFAVGAAHLYYTSTDPTIHATSAPSAIPVNATSIRWYSVAQGAGTFIGDFARNILSVPVEFATSTVDRAFHVQESLDFFQMYGYRCINAALLGFSVYLLSLLAFRFLLNIQTLVSKQWILWNAQLLFLKETEETIERAITGIVRPFLIKSYEQFLCQTSETPSMKQKTKAFIKSIYLAYNNNLNMLREALFERAEVYIKTLSFSELLNQGQVSKQYLNGLNRLIKNSDRQLSMLLYDLNDELARIPAVSKRLLMN